MLGNALCDSRQWPGGVALQCEAKGASGFLSHNSELPEYPRKTGRLCGREQAVTCSYRRRKGDDWRNRHGCSYGGFPRRRW